MPYILNKTNGTNLATVQDGSINQSTSLVFVGRNYAGYGEIVNENFLKLLENFSNSTAPSKPITGQIWYDSSNKKLKTYNGSKFQTLPFIQVASSTPTDTSVGDFWFNTSDGKLYFNSGTGSTGFTLISSSGGTSTSGSGSSAINVTDITDNTVSVIKHAINNIPVAVTSNSSFNLSPSDPLSPYFNTIKKGITLAKSDASTGRSDLDGYYFWGTASYANRLGGYTAAELIAASAFDTTNGIVINNDLGITMGSGGILKIYSNDAQNKGIIELVKGNGESLDFKAPYPTINDVSRVILTLQGDTLYPGEVSTNLGSTSKLFNSAYASRIFVGDGAVASPSITFNSDQDTGFNWGGSGYINITNNGVYSGQIGTGTLSMQAQIVSGSYIQAASSIVAGSTVSTPSITKTGTNGTGDIGQSGNRFGTVYGSVGNFYLSGGNVLVVSGNSSAAITADVSVSRSSASDNVGQGPCLQLSTPSGTSPTTGYLIQSGSSGDLIFFNYTSGWAERVRFASSGNITTVGTITATGSIYSYSNLVGFYTSDIKFKENVRDITNAISTVSSIGGKTYDWTDEYLESNGGEDEYFRRKKDFGVIAQDVEKVFPLAVRKKSDGTLAVDYEKLVALSFAAVKELNSKVEQLEAVVNALLAKI